MILTGYTHYYNRPRILPKAQFLSAAADLKKVLDHLQAQGLPLGGSDGSGTPDFTPTYIAFNGVGDDAHETFYVPQVFTPHYPSQEPHLVGRRKMWFDFCKTARKPYDVAAVAGLIVFKHHFGEKFLVSSDGDDEPEMWVEGKAVCQEVLGYGGDFELDEA